MQVEWQTLSVELTVSGSKNVEVAAFSDDGVRFTWEDLGTGDSDEDFDNTANGQPLSTLSKSLKYAGKQFEPGHSYRITIDYRNLFYTGNKDVDGVTLIAFGGDLDELKRVDLNSTIVDHLEAKTPGAPIAGPATTDDLPTLFALTLTIPDGMQGCSLLLSVTGPPLEIWHDEDRQAPVPVGVPFSVSSIDFQSSSLYGNLAEPADTYGYSYLKATLIDPTGTKLGSDFVALDSVTQTFWHAVRRGNWQTAVKIAEVARNNGVQIALLTRGSLAGLAPVAGYMTKLFNKIPPQAMRCNEVAYRVREMFVATGANARIIEIRDAGGAQFFFLKDGVTLFSRRGFHQAVLSNGRIYDALTGPKGMTQAAYLKMLRALNLQPTTGFDLTDPFTG
ncbi:hypothetical protein [Stratiformator vulcanicus]|nr:hypothetical protein [Stratiformator vulcanicus]